MTGPLARLTDFAWPVSRTARGAAALFIVSNRVEFRVYDAVHNIYDEVHDYVTGANNEDGPLDDGIVTRQ